MRPEVLRSAEIGYVGRFPSRSLTLDARLYHERMDDIIKVNTYPSALMPPGSPNPNTRDYVNLTGLTLQGLEYQVRWKPFDSTELWLNQSFSNLSWDDPNLERKDERRPPKHATLLAWFQRLPGQVQLSVIHERQGSMTWRDYRDWMSFSRRTDVRLAYPFRIGAAKAEAAFTVQSLEGDRPFFLIRRHFELARKSFFTLRMEM